MSDPKQPDQPDQSSSSREVRISISEDRRLWNKLQSLGCVLKADGSMKYHTSEAVQVVQPLFSALVSNSITKDILERRIDEYLTSRQNRQTPYRLNGTANPPAATGSKPIERPTPRPVVVGTVSFSPPGSTYREAVRLRMSCATPRAVILYSMDGSAPTEDHPIFRSDVMVDRCCTVSARAFLSDVWGPVAQEKFEFVPDPVSFNPPGGGPHTPSLSVRVLSRTPGAVVRYTLDKSEPTELSPACPPNGNIILDKSTTIRARVFVPGWTPSPEASAEYIVEMPTWKVLEPEDPTDQVPHEISELVEGSGGWWLAAASSRGKLHAHRGYWREDSFAIGSAGRWNILVVSDGAGSSRLSRVGSNLVCRNTLDSLKKNLCGFEIPVNAPADAAPSEEHLLSLKAILKSAALEALGTVRQVAEERKLALDDLSATLLCLVQTEWNGRGLAASLQAGDGAIAILSEPGGLSMMGFADSGDFSGETRFITTKGVEDDLDRRVFFGIKDNVQIAAAMTDGVADDYFPGPQKLPELFNELLEKPAKADDPALALAEWIKYEKKGSTDDRTLAFMFRKQK